VRRDQDTVDARAFHANLTDTGRALLAQARVTHDAVIHDLFGARLSATEIHAMTRVLARVLGPDRRS
jgi:DNA-binding MarR family transcriptional regulator